VSREGLPFLIVLFHRLIRVREHKASNVFKIENAIARQTFAFIHRYHCFANRIARITNGTRSLAANDASVYYYFFLCPVTCALIYNDHDNDVESSLSKVPRLLKHSV